MQSFCGIHGVNLRKLVRFYISIFNVAAYQRLSTSGICSLSPTASQLHDRCIYTGSGISTACKSYCDNDNVCNGYDYSTSSSQCCFYTTASCPSSTTQSHFGNTGVLVNYDNAAWSGCFKRIGKYF